MSDHDEGPDTVGPATVSLDTLAGLRVVASDTAEAVGDLKSFVVDTSGRSVVRVQVAGRRRKATFLPWSSLTVGPDGVMVAPGASPIPAGDERDHDTAAGDLTLIGSRILGIDGLPYGTVTGAEIDPVTGSVAQVRADNATFPASRIRGFGHFALVVDPG